MIDYANIRIYSSEKARYEGKPLAEAVVHYLHGLKIAARCSVFRGQQGLYETGEISTDALADLSYNLPVLIDVLVPSAASSSVLEHLRTMVTDGLVGVLPVSLAAARSPRRWLPPHLLVRDVMSAPPVVAHPDFSVRTVVELMLDRGLKALPVVDGGVPIGMITTTDLLAVGMPTRTGLFPLLPSPEQEEFLEAASGLGVRKVMSSPPLTVAEAAPASQAVHLLVSRGKKRLPVVDAQGKLVGMVARIDLMKAVAAGPSGRQMPPGASEARPQSLRELARFSSVPVNQSDDLITAIDTLVKQGEERAAVVDGQGRLVGMVSDRELFGVLDSKGLWRAARRLLGGPDASRGIVSAVMKKGIVSLRDDAGVDEALSLMVERGLKRLPVVDGEGRFQGMVRRDSLLAALSNQL
jgi:CBS-domain-containing membrane protein/PII-like signaling protein